jgi:hypothetical protein
MQLPRNLVPPFLNNEIPVLRMIDINLNKGEIPANNFHGGGLYAGQKESIYGPGYEAVFFKAVPRYTRGYRAKRCSI